MDRSTFLAHRAMWVTEKTPSTESLTRLTEPENALHRELLRGTLESAFASSRSMGDTMVLLLVLRLSSTTFGMMTPADREIRLGLWKLHILHHAEAREVGGTWLLEELAEHGHRLSPGTLYPAIARMEKNGWLARTGDAAHDRARKTFRITPVGRRLLRSLRRDLTELYEELVLGKEPR